VLFFITDQYHVTTRCSGSRKQPDPTDSCVSHSNHANGV